MQTLASQYLCWCKMNTRIRNFLQLLSKRWTWGGAETYLITVRMFECDVHVHIANQTSTIIEGISNPSNSAIHVVYSGPDQIKNHYDSLRLFDQLDPLITLDQSHRIVKKSVNDGQCIITSIPADGNCMFPFFYTSVVPVGCCVPCTPKINWLYEMHCDSTHMGSFK